jgi:hypothetical protein
MRQVTRCLGRVVDILEASGAFDPGSSPGRGVDFFKIISCEYLAIQTGAIIRESFLGE